MAPVGFHLRRGIAATVGALVLGNLVPVAVDGAEAPSDGTSPVVFFTPTDGGTTTSAVHLMLGADPGVVSVQLEYSTNGGIRWQPIGERLVRRTGSTVFDTTWNPTLTGSVRVRATGYDTNAIVVGSPAEETVTLSASSTRFGFTTPGVNAARVGVFKRTDGRWYAAVSGTTTGILAPTVDAPPPVATTTPTLTTTLPDPTGIFDSTTGAFTAPVDLSAYAGPSPGPAAVPVRVSDGTSSDAVDAPIYTQVVTAVRSTTTTLPNTEQVTVTTRVTDQYGQPVPGAPVRLSGYASGATKAVAELAVTDVLGTATFTGPGTGPAASSPRPDATGYPAGFYNAYTDLNLDGKRGAKEPGYESVVGTVSFAAPGKAVYHDNKRIAGAGGVLADSPQGTRAAAAKGYPWIDQDGQLSYTSHAGKRRGPARVSQAAHLTWVNAHGAPFNPRWLKRGSRFETRSWGAIRKHPGLRDAEMTFQQNAAYGISVEWEVKDIRPFTTRAALDAAFTNLAAAAQRTYGPAWSSKVEVKMLSNLSGGPAFALKVLKVAHAHGFTTIYLARGNATRVQMPASAHRYITYVRGAGAGLYAPVPPASQDTPVVVTGPPAVAKR